MFRKSPGFILTFLMLFIALHVFAGDQDFILINKTGVEIHELFISAHSADNWEEDVLGVDTLPDDEQVRINFSHTEDECLWDIMVTDDEENDITWEKINLCKYSTITLYYKNGKAWAECE